VTLRRRRDIWDVAIVGGGIAGLTAAWHAVRRGLAPCLFEPQPGYGGQVATVNEIDDWPATGPVSGVELAASLAAELSHEIVELNHEAVASVQAEGELLRVSCASHSVRARRVIAASGGRLRTLGVPGEEALRGKGVSQCAHCDGGFFRNQDVVVVGGGDAALQEALVLAETSRTVYLVARSRLKARAAYVERAAGKPNVHFVWDSTVDAIDGKDGVTGVRLRNLRTGATSELACSGVFPFVGVAAETAYLPAGVRRDGHGCVLTDAELRSSLAGVFAVGALRSGYGGDLVSAAGEAALAVAVAARELAV
jgi:thioredoxin reductase (NADPH)